MSPTLISSIISGAANLFPAIGGLFAHGFKGFRSAWQSMGDAITGAHLTGAQREANAFTAEQAQKQMDFQQQMRDSQYQSAVADMKSAGLNPAVMYGSGASGNSAPSGAMASSVAPSSPDVTGLLGQIANLSLLRSQKANLDANTGKTLAETDLTKQNIVESNARIQQIKANVRQLGLSADAQEIVNKYLERKENVALQNMTLEGDKLAAEWTEIQQKISNLGIEQQKMLQDIAESSQRVSYLLAQERLNDEQIKEVQATIARINQERDNLVKTGKVLDKDIDFYEWNHGSEVVIAGQRSGSRYIPSRRERDKNR